MNSERTKLEMGANTGRMLKIKVPQQMGKGVGVACHMACYQDLGTHSISAAYCHQGYCNSVFKKIITLIIYYKVPLALGQHSLKLCVISILGYFQ